ncbi:hypothetical protein [Alcaligenes endophyticus]|uniref:Phage tail assembly protein n=1 Tax=Alcaligenes endophyticus TaxID=1929088 RepID=A0ABT8ENI5_9BURK|nr:hypothetical protein [Alcaligenes endophyticus]MCX5592796.1 hypothetical protein [Alcaligenes endophyticus]MDN4122838.1 hypothetical protein [Alcaligenes endophyticus]
MSTQGKVTVEPIPSSVITDDMFASGEVIEHPVKLGDGSVRTLYFKELEAIEWKRHMEAENSKDKKVREGASARLIARSLVERDGSRALTIAQAARLKPAVSGAIFLGILQVNGFSVTNNHAEGAGSDELDDLQDGDLGN